MIFERATRHFSLLSSVTAESRKRKYVVSRVLLLPCDSCDIWPLVNVASGLVVHSLFKPSMQLNHAESSSAFARNT